MQRSCFLRGLVYVSTAFMVGCQGRSAYAPSASTASPHAPRRPLHAAEAGPLPVAVRAAVEREYPDASIADVQAVAVAEWYLVLGRDGDICELNMSSAGEVLAREETELQQSITAETPAAVRAVVDDRFPRGVIYAANELRSGPESIWEIKTLDCGEQYFVRVGAGGALLEEGAVEPAPLSE